MIEFLEWYLSGKELPVQFRRAEEIVGPRMFRISWIHLLGWLKDRCRLKKRQSLELNLEYPSHLAIIELVSMIEDLNRLFEVKGSRLDFRASVPEDEIRDVEMTVDRLFNPSVLTKLCSEETRSGVGLARQLGAGRSRYS